MSIDNCESYFQDFCRVRKERDEARADMRVEDKQ
jgi:hypothetical protein